MSRRLRIGMISTVNLPTPPVGYGGIERVVHAFVEELIRQGHHVTLFGRPGSHCSGETVEVAGYGQSMAVSGGRHRLDEELLADAVQAHVAREKLDVLHDWSLENIFVNRNPDALPFVVSTCVPQPPGYAQRNVIADSAAHAATLKGGTAPFVHFGIDVAKVPWSPNGGTRLVQLAKISWYKGQHLAMLAAAMALRPLDVVGNEEGRRYGRYLVRPLAAMLPNVRLLGETKDVEGVLMGARALVLAPRWFETYPLVSMQALCAGTPVVALDSGGLDEQVRQGENGFLAKNVLGLARAMRDVDDISRTRCREMALEQFDVRHMVRHYLEYYARVMDGETW
ncbi:glycosyltransferase [Humitalea sp. 24SJ18S-53]|uniref:glycosyltransferase n=1 Tax=Humitalea sp. 24SJ18S-53 TaxID=3422307 RepID=UPI003D66ECFF